MSDIMQGITKDGKDWKKQELILEFNDVDENGNSVMRESGEPLTNYVKLDIFGKRVEEVNALGVNVNNWVWANIRINTETKTSVNGRRYVDNSIYLVEMRPAQKVANG